MTSVPFSFIFCYSPKSNTDFINIKLIISWICQSLWCLWVSFCSLFQYVSLIIKKTSACPSKPTTSGYLPTSQIQTTLCAIKSILLIVSIMPNLNLLNYNYLLQVKDHFEIKIVKSGVEFLVHCRHSIYIIEWINNNQKYHSDSLQGLFTYLFLSHYHM